MSVHRPWASKPARIDYLKLIGAVSDRHVEIMRDDLSEIYYDADPRRRRVRVRRSDHRRSPTTATSHSSTARRGDSTSSSAPTGCTPECAGSCSATTCPNASSVVTSRWCQCRNRSPATARWTATSNRDRVGDGVHRRPSRRRTGGVHLPAAHAAGLRPPRRTAPEELLRAAFAGSPRQSTGGSTRWSARRRSISTPSPSWN